MYNADEMVHDVQVLTREEIYHNYVNDKIREAEEWAKSPNAKWLTHDEVMRRLKDRYGI